MEYQARPKKGHGVNLQEEEQSEDSLNLGDLGAPEIAVNSDEP